MDEPAALNERQHATLGQLPIELLCSIASFLSLEDFRVFRLVCRLAALSTRSLLAGEDFNGLLWRPDAARLYHLSQMPECAGRIRSVTFNFARLNDYKALHDSYSHHFSLEPELRTEVLHTRWRHYFQTQQQVKTLGGFRLDLAKEAFKTLRSLERLTLTWTRPPWDQESEACRLFSADVSIRMAKWEVFDVQKAIVRQVGDAATKLHTLNLEPITLWGPARGSHPDNEPETASGQEWDLSRTLVDYDFVTSLRRLSLVVERKSEVAMEAGLTALLGRTTALKELRLEYTPWIRVRPSSSFLEGVYISDLEVLELVGLEVGLQNLGVFIARHRGTLRRLDMVGIKGISPSEAEEDSGTDGEESLGSVVAHEDDRDTDTAWVAVNTWTGLFTMIRERLSQLKEVQISNLFTDPDSGGRCWFCQHAVDGDAGVPEGVHMAPAQPLEKYLLGEGEMMPPLNFT
jgi:hypothetical protein